jgi:hypothetical protein
MLSTKRSLVSTVSLRRRPTNPLPDGGQVGREGVESVSSRSVPGGALDPLLPC